jgi:hypothetical protein
MTVCICRACQGAGVLHDINIDDDLDEVTLDCPECINGLVSREARDEQNDFYTDDDCTRAAIDWATGILGERGHDD